MSQKVQCERCGGEDFRLENGFYFCSECQLQSQDIQEQVLDDYYGGFATISTKVRSEDRQSRDQELPGTKLLSSVEVLNYILKGIVDELLALGAPKKLKIITLQLWASYLRKIEIAFTSTSALAPKKPKLTLWSRKGDVARFYKVRKPMSFRDYSRLARKRRKGTSTKTKSYSDLTESESSFVRKRRLNAKKASLARAEYDESCASMNLSSQATSLHSLDYSVTSQSDVVERIQYSKKGKKDVKDVTELLNKQHKGKIGLLRRINRKHGNAMEHPRIKHLFVIVRIALMISGSDIHVGDLFRWIEEGYFSIVCGKKFIPPEVILSSDQVLMISHARKTQNARKIFIFSKQMVDFLGVTNVGLPPSKIIGTLVRRYCKTLNLPDNVSNGIIALLKLKPPKLWLDSKHSNFEGRAMALIIFSLKILIGLDDVTEYNYVPRKDVEGVKWIDWCRHYEASTAKKAVHHYPTLVRHYPSSYVGRNQSFLSHWDPSTNYLAKSNIMGKTESSMIECFKRVLKPLACKLDEPSWRPGLEYEEQPAEPPLGVLSECIDGTMRKGERSIILEKPIPGQTKKPFKKKPKDAPDLNIRVWNDDVEVKVRCRQKKNQQSSAGVKKVTGNEDYSVWVHHNVRQGSKIICQKKFAHFAAEKFPHSFWWLLQQTAEIVHQSPADVYEELIRVEKVYSDNQFYLW